MNKYKPSRMFLALYCNDSDGLKIFYLTLIVGVSLSSAWKSLRRSVLLQTLNSDLTLRTCKPKKCPNSYKMLYSNVTRTDWTNWAHLRFIFPVQSYRNLI